MIPDLIIVAAMINASSTKFIFFGDFFPNRGAHLRTTIVWNLVGCPMIPSLSGSRKSKGTDNRGRQFRI